MLPAARVLLRGLLGNDLLGFHTRRYVVNFFACVADLLPGAKTDVKNGIVRYREPQDSRPAVSHFDRCPDHPAAGHPARRGGGQPADLAGVMPPPAASWCSGVDRADYTKGIPHRLAAFGRMLEQHPELLGRVTLVQIAVPSRSDISEYQDLEREIEALVAEINRRHGRAGWSPIVHIQDNLDHATLVAWYRAADVCIVSPVQDGMNLVAKEYVAAQVGKLGVLLLSQFAGAAEELEGALLINPYDESSLARTLYVALTHGSPGAGSPPQGDAEAGEQQHGAGLDALDFP